MRRKRRRKRRKRTCSSSGTKQGLFAAATPCRFCLFWGHRRRRRRRRRSSLFLVLRLLSQRPEGPPAANAGKTAFGVARRPRSHQRSFLRLPRLQEQERESREREGSGFPAGYLQPAGDPGELGRRPKRGLAEKQQRRRRQRRWRRRRRRSSNRRGDLALLALLLFFFFVFQRPGHRPPHPANHSPDLPFRGRAPPRRRAPHADMAREEPDLGGALLGRR